MFVLGAQDPEMMLISDILARLRDLGLPVKFTWAFGARGNVSASEAYNASSTFCSKIEEENIYFVECCLTDEAVKEIITHPSPNFRFLDHHKKGDHGYGMEAKCFLPASSIGQVLEILQQVGLRYHSAGSYSLGEGVKVVLEQSGYYLEAGQMVNYHLGQSVVATHRIVTEQEVLFVAAADHCLAAAYHGKCPGVNPDELMGWRISTRAKFQNLSEDELLARVDRAREILRKAEATRKNHVDEGPDTEGKCPLCLGIVDLREGGGEIQELPEAAVREGLAFLSTTTDRGGRKKVVLQVATSEQIKWFLGEKNPMELKDCYGDPARGFAGGYIA